MQSRVKINNINMVNLGRSPPPLPPAYGTSLNPAESIKSKLEPGFTLDLQMSRLSSDRIYKERNEQLDMREETYRETRRKWENSGYDRYCHICSESKRLDKKPGTAIFHTHKSSKNTRITSLLDSDGNYDCTSCASSPHSSLCGIRYPVLATTSTLNNWQENRVDPSKSYLGNPFHVDSISIPEGILRDVRHAVYSEFGEVNRPVDLLVVAGLNDIAKGLKRKRDIDTVEYFANEIHMFNTMSVAMNLNMGKTSGK